MKKRRYIAPAVTAIEVPELMSNGFQGGPSSDYNVDGTQGDGTHIGTTEPSDGSETPGVMRKPYNPWDDLRNL